MKIQRVLGAAIGVALAALPAWSQRSATAKETAANVLKQKLDKGE